VTRELFYSRQARADLEEIFWFIVADNPRRAATYIAEIEAACEGLRQTPMKGVARPDLRPELRILPLWRRVVIAYQITPERIEVLRIFSGGQNYDAIMGGAL